MHGMLSGYRSRWETTECSLMSRSAVQITEQSAHVKEHDKHGSIAQTECSIKNDEMFAAHERTKEEYY